MLPRHIIFGSVESQDTDIIVWISLESINKQSHVYLKMCKDFEKMFSEHNNPNVCLGYWTFDKLHWAQKGTELAETNNSIIATRKSGDLIGWNTQQRDPQEKIIGSLRSILARITRCGMTRDGILTTLHAIKDDITPKMFENIFCGDFGSKQSNSDRNRLVKERRVSELLEIAPSDIVDSMFRKIVLTALKMRTTGFRLRFLETIDLTTVNWSQNPKKSTPEDRLKHVAFQMCQTISLIRGVEIYDKQDAARLFPPMANYLNREPCYNSSSNHCTKNIQEFKQIYCASVRDTNPNLLRTEFDNS